MNTPRTHDDGRNERQRQEQEKVERQRQADRDVRQRDYDEEKSRQGTHGRAPDDGLTARQRLAREKEEPDFLDRMREEREHHDYIERTRPEDPSEHFGQLTRDNVNPDIPSAPKAGEAKKGEVGGIVDPNSLGMDQGQQGAQPPPPEDQREQWPQEQKWPASGEYDKGDDLQQQHEPRVGAPIPEPLRTFSINEPPGSNVIPGADTGPVQLPGDGSALPPGTELPPLALTDISPDTATAGSPEDLVLTVTGTGFTPNCVVMVDDEDMATSFVDQTTLTASVPVAAEPGMVDVEVARDEELSDVLTFEFVAPAGTRSSQKAERKPKKTEPRGKRQKKDKKGKR
jgi:hypothetical protein